MNWIVDKYAKGKSVTEKLRLFRVWQTVEARVLKNEELPNGKYTLPQFGRVAVQFIREVERTSKARRKTIGNRS